MTKQIGETLIYEEFNRIQTLLRANKEYSEEVSLQNQIDATYCTIDVVYGNEYYKRQSGIITNDLKLKIRNPVIPIMNYKVTLSYKSLNPDLLDNDDNLIETVTYEIPVGEYFTIPEATLEHIIFYDILVTVSILQPQMQKPNSLILNQNEFFVGANDEISVIAKLMANKINIDNVPVNFEVNGIISQINTNDNGESILDYTGSEAGKLDYTISFDNLSQHFVIYDSIFHNDVFYNHSNRITIDGKNLNNNTNTTAFYLIDETGVASNLTECRQYNPPFIVIFKIKDYTNGAKIQLYDGSHTVERSLSVLCNQKQDCTIIVDVQTDRVDYYVDGELIGNRSWIGDLGLSRAGLRFDSKSSCTYEDIYLCNAQAVVKEISLTGDNNLLSLNNPETVCTLTAVYTENEIPIENKTVEFFNGETSLGVSMTDANGVATKVYSSMGAGDMSITAKAGGVTSEPYNVEDCIFFDATETSKTTGSSAVYSKVYNDLSITDLPEHFVWEMDMKTSSNSGSENRFFFTPTNFSGDQPTYALWVQIAGSGASKGGSRRNGSYNPSGSVTISANTYGHFKVERHGDTIDYYVNGTSVGSLTETWIDDYSSWWFSYTFWKRPNITGTWKNLKIKKINGS